MSDLVSFEVGSNEVCVLIRGIPHLMIRRPGIVSIQSYQRISGARYPIYFIAVVTSEGPPTITDYDRRDLWEAVLKGLHALKIFDSMHGEGSLYSGA